MKPVFNRRRFLRVAGGSVVLPLLAGCVSSDTPLTVQSTEQGSSQNQSTCELPVFTDEFIGFNVGLPRGWKLDYTRGTIWLWPSDGSERSIIALVYPLRPQRDLSPDQIIAAYVRSLNAGFNGTLTINEEGQLEGTMEGTPVEGELRIKRIGPDYVVWGGFGVPDMWATWRETILNIGVCYRPRTGRPLTRGTATGSGTFGTTTWHYVIPTDWVVRSVTDIEIDIAGDWDGTLGVWNAHINRALLPNLTWQRTPADAAQYVADSLTTYSRWELVRWTGQTGTAQKQNPDGSVTSTQVFAYEARNAGYSLTGEMAVTVTPSLYGTSGAVALRETISSEWNRLAAITYYIMSNSSSGIFTAHPSASGGAAIEDIIMDVDRYREAVMDEAATQWEETIMGFETLGDPGTGTIYQLPLNSHDPTSGCPSGYVHPERGYPDCLVRV